MLGFIARHQLHGEGIGYVDVHLLAAMTLTTEVKLWTRDKGLRVAAVDLGLAYADTDVV